MAKRLAKKVIIYTDGSDELSTQILDALGEQAGGAISVDRRPVARLTKVKDGSSETIVHLDDGTSTSHGLVVSLHCQRREYGAALGS